ncbi:potassium channel family protein [Enterococcus faecalis]|uniref:potassium channel family protein n=1 Tax=Enterococcus faecalis TaxID=1351 RepID=UPI0019E46F7A|nr:two pore domain potassium channel family protein [Enterococcus faecalis]EGO6705116.1 two pore domain potassium channel family protein [Enterococcus faecalis]
MLSLLISVKKLFSSFLGILKKEDTRALFFLLVTTLLSGTIFYSTVEKLSPLDSLYLSFMTLTTIGYGDVHPVTDLGKIFTMVYATVGLGIMAMFISVVAKSYLYSKQSHHHHHHKNKEHSAEKSSEK